jgi:hypothetical protein
MCNKKLSKLEANVEVRGLDRICNFVLITGVNDMADKLFIGVNNTGDKLSLVKPVIKPCLGFSSIPWHW